jgi:hypothetical protein
MRQSCAVQKETLDDPNVPKAEAVAAGRDCRKQYRVQVCPFLPGADETRVQSRDGETREETSMSLFSVTAEKTSRGTAPQGAGNGVT